MKISQRACFTLAATALFFALVPAAVDLFPSLADSQDTDCDIDRGPCTKSLGETGITATFELLPRPVQTLKTLLCRVDLKQGQLPVTDRFVRLSFSMPGMYMPENAVVLRHAGKGIYEGNVIIVRCPSGMKLWRAEAQIGRLSDRERHPNRVSYTFTVR
ncbi:MAG: hypothetical protein ACM33C_06630 [Syntrophaceae bacterium]